MIAEKIPQLKTLSADEKLILVGELWEELAKDPAGFPPREDHVRLLRERLEEYRKNPVNLDSWETVKARILASQ